MQIFRWILFWILVTLAFFFQASFKHFISVNEAVIALLSDGLSIIIWASAFFVLPERRVVLVLEKGGK